MGVPKFFRWCAERYPSVITPFKDTPPPVDNLYLDMNGIIHNCSHSNDIDATQRSATERDMMLAMFSYLEKLFAAIQPRKYFVMAIDGVAPRAKMNQQRQRRYRSAYENMVAREAAIAQGREVPDERDVFDSNCITPGTPFMVRVSEAFQYFVTMKLATDAAWQNCEVIFSGHDCPGEGEHKLMDFMRRRKMQPGYDANETHCMYGLDADLIMLALATHEPHFVLLREVVTFGPGSYKERAEQEKSAAKGLVQDKTYQKEDEFVLFHIGVLRDYLQLEVREKLDRLGAHGTFDFERVVDDFVFMCFFIGNDFLPSLPTLSIHDGSVTVMLQLYIDHVLYHGRYLTDKGAVDWRTTEVWLSRVGGLELTTLQTRQQDEAAYQRQRARRDPDHEVPINTDVPITSIAEYKERFYREKHRFAQGWHPGSGDMTRLALHYIEGLTWVLRYYYQGVPSWQWYYPHYYAPLASDLANLPAIAARVQFSLGQPFLPHQQLLAVLPPMSYRSIPRAYWPLLRSPASPLAKYFPEHLEIDREGARAEWEGIVLIPFINEQELLAAYASVQRDVSAEDAAHNTLGPSLRFAYDAALSPPRTLTSAMFGTLHHVLVRREPYEFPPYRVFVPRLCEGVCTSSNCQLEGFSSLQSKRLLLTPSFEVGKVNIFGTVTRRESLLLNLHDNAPHTLSADAAAALLGREVLVGFPHYKRARVAALSDVVHTLRATYASDGTFAGVERRTKNRSEAEAFVREAETHQRYMTAKLGIAVARVDVLVYVHRFSGMRVARRGFVVRRFAGTETCYPLALLCALEDVQLRADSRYVEGERAEADMARGARCVYIGPEPKTRQPSSAALAGNVFGSCGYISASASGKDVAAVVAANNNNSNSNNNSEQLTLVVRVYTQPLQLPASLAGYAARTHWVSAHEVAEHLHVRTATVLLICGSLETSPHLGSREIGLTLVHNNNSGGGGGAASDAAARRLARVGYAKLVLREHNPWYVGGADYFARMEHDPDDLGHHLARTERGDYVGSSRSATAFAVQHGVWYFSREAVRVLRAYAAAFAPLLAYLDAVASSVNPRSVEVQQCLTGPWVARDAGEVVDDIEAFVAQSGVCEASFVQATEDAFPPQLLRELEEALVAQGGGVRPTREMQLRQVARRTVYVPLTRSAGGHLVPLPLPLEQHFYLGARVVNCRATGAVPFGACGTLIRLLASGREAEVVYDEPFLGGSTLAGRLREHRGAITRLATLLVLPDATSNNNSSSGSGGNALLPVDQTLGLRLGGSGGKGVAAASIDPTSLLASMQTSGRLALTDDGNSNNNTAAADAVMQQQQLRTTATQRASPAVSPATAAAAAAATSSDGATATLSLTAADPRKGIQLGELVGRLASASSPPSLPSPHANATIGKSSSNGSGAAAAAATTTTMSGPATSSSASARDEAPPLSSRPTSATNAIATAAATMVATPAPAASNNNNSSSSSSSRRRAGRVIPDDFLSGRVRVSHADAAATLRKWIEALTSKELAAMLQETDVA